MIGGGGTWLIEASYTNYSNYWANRWEITDGNIPEDKPWTVSYIMAESNRPVINLQFDTRKAKDNLREALLEIQEFAFNRNLQHWGEEFRNAASLLDSSFPQESYYQKDLIPTANYSLTARQILFSAGNAWVFGGMGTWNDLLFNVPEISVRYEELTAQLYEAINIAVIAAINSY